MDKNLRFEDILVGTEIPPLVKLPTMQHLMMWAEASGDNNPIHYDKNFAVGAGLPGVVVPGQLVMAFLGQMVTDWLGQRGELERLSVSYKGMNFSGDTITCRGAIEDITDGLVTIAVWAENPLGEKTVIGTAAVKKRSRL